MELNGTNLAYLRMACEIASANVDRGGGPSGTVIVNDGALIATGADTVALDCDPTAHAVVNAIRRACQLTRCSTLPRCTVYCSCEPCPMCLGALYLAGVGRVCYAVTPADARHCDDDGGIVGNEIALHALEQRLSCISGAGNKDVSIE